LSQLVIRGEAVVARFEAVEARRDVREAKIQEDRREWEKGNRKVRQSLEATLRRIDRRRAEES